MAGSPQTITCRAAVCWGPGEPVKMEEIQVEPPKKGEVRLRMLCASICHSDVLLQRGFPIELFPRILGHEGFGTVESVGEGVTYLKIGDPVVPAFLGHCGQCLNCMSNKSNFCLRYPITLHGLMTTDQTSRMSVRGQKLYHAFTCSTFSEYTVADVNYVSKIDPRVTPPHASCLSCGFSTGFGAVWKEAKVEKGASVVVFGLGAVGMGAVAGAKSQGASRIIGVDINNERKNPAVDFGITDFLNPEEITDGKSVSERIKEMTGGLGVEFCLECSGSAKLINEAFASAMPGKGMAVIVGTTHERTATINPLEFVKGKTLKGSVFGGLKPQLDIPTLADKCLNMELQLDRLITHELAFSDIVHAFEILKQPSCLKVVLKFDDNKVVE